MKESRIREIKAILLFAIAIIVFISLLSFDYNDLAFFTSRPSIVKSNIVGAAGAYLGFFLIFIMGKSAFVIPFVIAIRALGAFAEEKPRRLHLQLFGMIFFILAVSAIASLIGQETQAGRFARGGITGLVFSDFLLRYLGSAGSSIVITVLVLLSFLIATDFMLLPFLSAFLKVPKKIAKYATNFFASVRIKREKPKLIRASRPEEAPRIKPPVKMPVKTKLAPEAPKTKKEAPKPVKIKEPAKPYELPSLELLDSPPPMGEREIKDNFEENSKILEETLLDFGIEAKVVEASKGPVITRYELLPARGVQVHRISALIDDISRSMKATSVRIVAPVPGKGTVGVEVPNSKGTLVYLKEVIESKEYKKPESLLKLALGKDISGAPIVTELDDMPHLLIAGATGSGKTVCVNSIISSLLFNATPDELKFIMIDPKRVELAAFNGLPHLLAPVVTEPKKVSHTLSWVVDEMERRYVLFAEVTVRNIDGYNKKAKRENFVILPYIILIIDELADLMLVSAQEVENMITRLAQLSRAVGIHIIIATQRPSVDVITGVIKANFPARISFKVASKVDSRTVLDVNGAEKLLGKGDMLFMEPGTPKPVRAQGCLVSDEEIEKLASFIKSQRGPEFVEDIVKAESKMKHKSFEKDEIYEEAVKVVLQTKQASVSMLQRRLGVGYTRAARLVDMMEDEGIVGPYQGSKPREILIEGQDGS